MRTGTHLSVVLLIFGLLVADARKYSRARVLQGPVSRQGQPLQDLGAVEAAIVLSRVEEDVSWLDLSLPHLAHFVYQNGDNSTTGYGTSNNTCGESIVYLTFIIDYYHLLPEEIVFAHAHRDSWHLKDKAAAVARLQWGRHGFANLRHANMTCPEHWTCPLSWRRLMGTPPRWTGAWLHPKDYTDVGDITEPLNRIRWSYNRELRDSKILAAAWQEVFLGLLGPLPDVVHSPCCAEFVVTRAQVLRRPRDFYIHLREWASSGRLPPTSCGRVFEHTWAMIFGEEPVSEAKAECDLLFCDSD